MTAEHSTENSKRLTDEELSRLLESGLEPSERAALVERLHGDPEAIRALALALSASRVPAEKEGLSEDTIERALETVREAKGKQDICPHCAGDLFPGGTFCPHCSGQVDGNVVTCMKCGKPVREGSAYCPHCGSFFRPARGGGLIESPFLLFVLGLLSVAIAIVMYMGKIFIYPFFLVIGCGALGAWFGERFLSRRTRISKAETGDKAVVVEEEEDERKTG